jgi:hypothetical protein
LLEVTVAATILVGLVLALSLTLISEAGRRIQHSGIQAGEPPVGRILDRLRADVWGSGGIIMPLDYDPFATWYEGPLVLSGHFSGYGLAYAAQDGVLYRVVQEGLKDPVATAVLQGVAVFHWTFLEQPSRTTVLLEVERIETGAYRGPDRVASSIHTTTGRIVLSPRRHGGTWW